MESVLETQKASSAPLKLSNIVVGLDLEESTHQALLTASALAARYKASLCVVHATYPPVYAGYVQDLSCFVERTLESAEARVADLLAKEPELEEFKYTVLVDIKSPAELLCRAAQERSADLIVVGTHGRHGIGQLLLGSVAESLLDLAPCPIMIAGPECGPCALPWKHILFATDLDNTGIRAAEYAASLSLEAEAELCVLHVMPRGLKGGSDMRNWIEDGIRRRLELLFVPALLSHLPHQLLVAHGDPVEEILAAAHAQKADLIILGTGLHRMGADHNPQRTLARMLREAHCPILNVRP